MGNIGLLLMKLEGEIGQYWATADEARGGRLGNIGLLLMKLEGEDWAILGYC